MEENALKNRRKIDTEIEKKEKKPQQFQIGGNTTIRFYN